jgi:hypothetical protein
MPLKPEVREEIFSILKTALEKHAPPMVVRKGKAGTIELIGNKPVPYGSKKTIVPGMYFSSAVTRKDMVSFYFFPIYYRQEEFMKLIPTLSKTLKGKTCFNIKKPEQVNPKELNALLKKGVTVWKKLGYVR